MRGSGAARRRRHERTRRRLSGTLGRPRLCVFRSLRHIYAQIIDDNLGYTIVSASTLDSAISQQTNGKHKTASAALVGGLIARRALDEGVTKVVFDKGGYKYHGRIKSLAEAAREAGLKF